jgi:RNA polymerase sigma-70 factor (ECF subfamily)
MNNNEKELIKRAKKDPQAFGDVYNAYYHRIFGYTLKRIADVDATKDIVSETFFKALKNLWQFEWRNISFSAWLFRIANNEISNYFRKGKIKKVSLDKIKEPFTVDNPLSEVLEAEENLKKHKDFLILHQNISKLNLRYQEVIVLRFFEKKRIKEIAEILGKKEGTVKSLIHRALEKLKVLMD